MKSNPEQLLKRTDWFALSTKTITQLKNYQQLVVGFSGGLDSTVLLHWLWSQRDHLPPIRAVHVHHALPDADQWRDHARSIAGLWQVPYAEHHIVVPDRDPEGWESAARKLRYRYLSTDLSSNDALLTAHHLNDHVETLMMRWVRGTGIAGLAGIKHQSRQQYIAPHIVRPLRHVSRADLWQYATEHQLTWVEDVGNQDTTVTRNWFRHEIIPKLCTRFPHALIAMARTAQHCEDADAILQECAQADLDSLGGDSKALPLAQLDQFSAPRIRHLLRYWIAEQGGQALSNSQLSQLVERVIFAQTDAHPQLRIGSRCYYRQAGILYCVDIKQFDSEKIPRTWVQTLRFEQEDLPVNSESLPLLPDGRWFRWRPAKHGLDRQRLADCTLQLTMRQGGERFHPAGRAHSQTLKKLLHEWQVPVQQRDQIMLLWANDAAGERELIWVEGIGVAQSWLVNSGAIPTLTLVP